MLLSADRGDESWFGNMNFSYSGPLLPLAVRVEGSRFQVVGVFQPTTCDTSLIHGRLPFAVGTFLTTCLLGVSVWGGWGGAPASMETCLFATIFYTHRSEDAQCVHKHASFNIS